MEKTNSKILLHTGTYDLPLSTDDNNQHYLYCDNTWHAWSKYQDDFSGYSRRMLKDADELERRSYEQMEHIFTTGEHIKKDLMDHYSQEPEKISVVGTGRGRIAPYYGEKDYSNQTILFVAKGGFEHKGGVLLVKGFRIAVQKNPDLRLIIVGDERYKRSIRDPNITIFGYVTWEHLQTLFNEASLFAMPALNEPWGLVYLEALSCRIPVIGLNRNALPEFTGHGKYGFLIDEESPTAISHNILTAFDDIELLHRMGIGGQEFVLNKYSWGNVVDKICLTIDRNSS